MVAGSSTARPDRDQDQVDADVAATRDRLVTAVEALVDRVHPQRIKQREVAGARHFAQTELESLKLLVFNAAGELRTERLTKAGGGAAGFLGLLLVLRSIVGRRSRATARRNRSGSSNDSGSSGPQSRASGTAAAAELQRSGRQASKKSEPRSEAAPAPARADRTADVTAPKLTRAERKRRATPAPAVTDDVDTRVRRARRKA